MSKRFITSAAAIAVLLAGFGIYWRGRQHSEQKPLRMSMNADGQKRLAQSLVGFKKYRTELAPLFNQATKVETFRIRMAEYGKTPGKTISGYPIIATGPDKSGSFAARLGEIILDADTYQMPGRDMKLCWFDPNVAFRLWEGRRSADVLICFHCTQLVVIENDRKLPVRTMGGDELRFRVGGDFDSARDNLLQLCKEVFPKDSRLK